MLSSKITTKGQVTIPIEYREHLGIKSGDKVGFTMSGGEVLIKKVDSKYSLAGILKGKTTKKATDHELADAIDQGWSKQWKGSQEKTDHEGD